MASTTSTSSGITCAPLDTFESISCWPNSTSLSTSVFLTSLAHRVPIILFSDSPARWNRYLSDTQLVEAVTAGFPTFSRYAAAHWSDLRHRFRPLFSDVIVCRPGNSHPLLRVLRDHWFWSWYEVLLTALKVREHLSTPSDVEIIYWSSSNAKITGQLSSQTCRGGRVLFGPVLRFTGPAPDAGDSIESVLAEFCSTIDNAWASIPHSHLPTTLRSRSGNHFALYNVATLWRIATSRAISGFIGPAIEGVPVARHIDTLTSVIDNRCPLGPFESVLESAAAITSLDQDIRSRISASYELRIPIAKDVSDPAINEITITIPTSARRSVWFQQPDTRLQNEQINRARETMTSAWRAYVHDSQVILDDWLNRCLWERVTRDSLETSWGDMGFRLTRFLRSVFMADECSIYKVDYGTDSPQLVMLGGYSEDRDGESKIAVTNEYMKNIASNSLERSRSISYRALDQNRGQYVAYERRNGPNSSLAFPRDDRWLQCGLSASALPIRVNSSVWGILELVGLRFDQFPLNMRSRLAEVVSTIGRLLSFQNVSSLLNRIDQITIDPVPPIQAKRTAILSLLLDHFLASDVALARVQHRGLDAPQITTVAVVGSHSAFRAGGNVGLFLENAISQLLTTGSPETTDIELGGERDRIPNASAERAKFNVIRLPAGSILGGSTAFLAIRFANPLMPFAGWHLPFQVLGQYALNAIETLESEVNWNRFHRAKYGHELIRSAKVISDVSERIHDLMAPLGGLMPPQSSHQLTAALSDLSRAKQSVRIYAEALTEGVAPHEDEDARVQAIVRMMAQHRGGPRSAVDFREMLHSAMYSRRAEARLSKIRLAPMAAPGLPRLRVDEFVLYEVLSTLLDNAVKYSSQGSLIRASGQARRNGFGFTISNLGPELYSGEQQRIFEDGVRGQYALKSLPETGSGLGLGYARRLLELMDGDLVYHDTASANKMSSDGFAVRWHHFTLIFPKGRLVNV